MKKQYNKSILTGQWSAEIFGNHPLSQPGYLPGKQTWIFRQLVSYIIPPGKTANGGTVTQIGPDGYVLNNIYLFMPDEKLLIINTPEENLRFKIEMGKILCDLYLLGPTEMNSIHPLQVIKLSRNN